MNDELPEYTGELSHCVQCDSGEADTEYVPDETPNQLRSDRRDPYGNTWPPQAFLKRTCAVCGFQWGEATRLDRPAPKPFVHDCPECQGSGRDPLDTDRRCVRCIPGPGI